MVLQMTSLGVNSTAVQHRECPLDVGQEVAVLQPPTVAASGWHRLSWERGALPAGLYFVQLLGDNLSQITRAELL